MHALCYGHTKPTLLFLHGLGTNSTDWQPQLSAFSPYYRVLAPDLPGHGQSEPLTSHRGIQEMTRALSRWLLTQNCGPVIVIGLSLGALVGLELLLKHPHQVLHAILINGTTDLRLTDPDVSRFFTQRIWFVRLFGVENMAKAAAPLLFPDPQLHAVRERFIQQLSLNSKAQYLRLLYSLQNWQASAELMQRNCVPVDIVSSELDYLSEARRRRLFAPLSYSRFHTLPGLHHAAPAESPERCNQLLQHLLYQALR